MGKKDEIQRLLLEGATYKQIIEQVGCAKSTINYYAKQLHIDHGEEDAGNRYDWQEIQKYHDAGYAPSECARHFGFSLSAWTGAVKRGAVIVHERKTPLEELLVPNRAVKTSELRNRLLEVGLLTYQCATCGIYDWNNRPLTLQLDHINGNNRDNRLENLRLLCPNCHSQTETYGSKNRKSRKKEFDPQRIECTACHQIKTIDDFSVCRDRWNGIASCCKTCDAKRATQRKWTIERKLAAS